MSPILIIGLIILAIIVFALILVTVGLRESRKGDSLQHRLSEFAARGEAVSLEQVELSQPFADRIILPLARSFGEFAIRFTPQNALQSTARKLELAGNPRGLEAPIFWALRFIASVGVGAFLFFIFTIGKIDWSWSRKLIIVVVFVALGFFLPELLLTSRIQRRQKIIRRSLPDALDLLTICVEAGLGFDGAMQRVYEKWNNELGLAFGRVIREISLGKLRREALRDMADRTGVPEMTSFVGAVIQSEQLGVSMAKVLRIQADQMRIKRRQRAEEEAHKAPIKMLIPMALLIFPSICIVLLSPAILMLFRSTLNNILFGG
jgi:tight adherence protein C